MTTDQRPPRRPELVTHSRFPRASRYDPGWILDNEMGPNVLWLTEFLCEAMDLHPGMRVLDLGCGKALSSVFLAREFGVSVWATDHWVPAAENARRIQQADLEGQVIPIQADARRLPFEEEFFDAVVSIDAFEYFGTEPDYLPTLVRHLRRGSQIGIVNAGVDREVDVLPPEWPSDFSNFHTPEWWKQLWVKSGCVAVETAEILPDGRELWLRWNLANGTTNDDYLTCAAGENLGFHRLVARRIDS